MGSRTIRAAVLESSGGPVSISELTLDPPGPGEVLVRIEATGVCHSDLSVADGTVMSLTPCVLGHEGAGVVEAVGPGVTKVRPGDHVIASWVAACRRCYYCVHGQPQLCLSGVAKNGTMDDGTTRLHRDGIPVYHGLNCATFAELTVLRESAVVPIAADIPFEVAALIGCGVTTGVGAAVRTAAVRPGERVAVIGCGGVGLSVVQGCHLSGASRIVAIDPVASRREAALRFGATHAVEPEGASRLLRELTDGIGADVVFEVVGSAALQRQAWEMTRRGGRTVFVGVAGFDQETSLPTLLLTIGERTLLGCIYGSADIDRDFPWLLELWRAGRLDLEGLVTQRLPLEGVTDAFEAMRRGEQLRTVLLPGARG
jgi:S-(hydroxymethyl)glutathione dehydrogenase/alcohol dehydrogenase